MKDFKEGQLFECVIEREDVPYRLGFIYEISTVDVGCDKIYLQTDDDNEFWVGADYLKKHFEKVEDESKFKTITDSIASLLEYKNEKYGNAALEPLSIFTNKTQVGQRIDDKLARIKNSNELRKNDVADLIGYLLLECSYKGWNNFDEFKD